MTTSTDTQKNTSAPLALAAISVVECGGSVAAAFAGKLLTLLGADLT